jgi:hypothetical protein
MLENRLRPAEFTLAKKEPDRERGGRRNPVGGPCNALFAWSPSEVAAYE